MWRAPTAAFMVLMLLQPVAGQEPDPLKTPACRAALALLDQAVSIEGVARRPERISAARRQAAHACLGASGDSRASRSGAPEPPQAVAAPRIDGGAAPALPSPPALAPPPVPIPRPAVITSCDPAGCWDSEGRRLNQQGPLLMGPNGTCTVQSGIASCP